MLNKYITQTYLLLSRCKILVVIIASNLIALATIGQINIAASSNIYPNGSLTTCCEKVPVVIDIHNSYSTAKSFTVSIALDNYQTITTSSVPFTQSIGILGASTVTFNVNTLAANTTTQISFTVNVGCNTILSSSGSNQYILSGNLQISVPTSGISYIVNAGTLNTPYSVGFNNPSAPLFSYPSSPPQLHLSLGTNTTGYYAIRFRNNTASNFIGDLHFTIPFISNPNLTVSTPYILQQGTFTPPTNGVSVGIPPSNTNSITPVISSTDYIFSCSTSNIITNQDYFLIIPITLNPGICPIGILQSSTTLTWGCSSMTTNSLGKFNLFLSSSPISKLSIFRIEPDNSKSPIMLSLTNTTILNTDPWESKCHGGTHTESEDSWTFLIKNTGDLASDDLYFSLNRGNGLNSDFPPYNFYTMIRSSTVNYWLVDEDLSPVSQSYCRALTTPNITTITTANNSMFIEKTDPLVPGDYTGSRHEPACLTALISTSDFLLDSMHVALNQPLLPGQGIILRFNTYRCCASDNPLDVTGQPMAIDYNRWEVTCSASEPCTSGGNPPKRYFGSGEVSVTPYSNSVQTKTGTPITNIKDCSGNLCLAPLTSGVTSISLYPGWIGTSACISLNRAGNNIAIKPNAYGEIGMTQVFNPQLITIMGGVPTGLGLWTPPFYIVNKTFPSDHNLSRLAFESMLFSENGTVGGRGGMQGSQPHGSIRVDFDVDGSNLSVSGPSVAGTLSTASTITFTKGNITWNAIQSGITYDAVKQTNHYWFDFDMAGTYTVSGVSQSNIFTTSEQFRLFFEGSFINFCLQENCSENHPNPTVRITTLFNPNQTTTCSTCYIPLSQVSHDFTLLCPGCGQPGMITTSSSLLRTNLGLRDDDDNMIPDLFASYGNSPQAINPNSLPPVPVNVIGSIFNDNLECVTTGNFFGGQPTSLANPDNFTYADWLNLNNTRPLTHLYLEQKVKLGIDIPLEATDYRIEYWCSSCSTPSWINGANTFSSPAGTSQTGSFPFDQFGKSLGNTNSGETVRVFLFHFDLVAEFPSVFSTTHPANAGDQFRVIAHFRTCTNPLQTDKVGITSYMYLSPSTLSGSGSQKMPISEGRVRPDDIITDWNQVSGHNLSSTTPQAVVATGGVNQDVAFYCQAFACPHTIYHVESGYTEAWQNTLDNAHADCNNTVHIGYSTYIIGDHGTDPFPYEYRAVSPMSVSTLNTGIVDSKGNGFVYHLPLCSNFTIQPVSCYNYTQTASDPSNTITIGTSIDLVQGCPTCIAIVNACPTCTTAVEYSLDFSKVQFSPPYLPQTYTVGNYNANGVPSLQSVSDLGTPPNNLLFEGDGSFNETIDFNYIPQCASIGSPCTIDPNDIFMKVPEGTQGCSNNSSVVIDAPNQNQVKLYIPNPNLDPKLNLGTLNNISYPQLVGNVFTNWIQLKSSTNPIPQLGAIANVPNFTIYIDIPVAGTTSVTLGGTSYPISLPPSITFGRLNYNNGTWIAPTPYQYQNGANTITFSRYQINGVPLADINNGLANIFFEMIVNDCNAAGTSVNVPIFYGWSCQSTPDLPINTQCSSIQAVTLSYGIPDVKYSSTGQWTLPNSTPLTPLFYQSCTPIHFSTDFSVATTGGIGYMTATFNLPTWASIVSNSGTVTYSSNSGIQTINIPAANISQVAGVCKIVLPQTFNFSSSYPLGVNSDIGTINLNFDVQVGDNTKLTCPIAQDLTLSNFQFNGVEYCNLGNSTMNTPHLLTSLPPITLTPALDFNKCHPFSATATPLGATCNGKNDGKITITTVGTGSYNYSWNNSATNTNGSITSNPIAGLSAGTYTVTVTDANSNCSEVISNIIVPADPAPLNVTLKEDINICGSNSGKITSTVTGGTSPYSPYSWTSNVMGFGTKTTADIDNLSVGTYTLNVTDANNCKATSLPLALIDHALSVSIDVDPQYRTNGSAVFTNTSASSIEVSQCVKHEHLHYILTVSGSANLSLLNLPTGVTYTSNSTGLKTTYDLSFGNRHGNLSFDIQVYDPLFPTCVSHAAINYTQPDDCCDASGSLGMYYGTTANPVYLDVVKAQNFSGWVGSGSVVLNGVIKVSATANATVAINNLSPNQLLMGPNAKIVVENGQTFNIHNTQISASSCDKMWYGIDVQDGGTLNLSGSYPGGGSIISDALYAVSASPLATISIINTDFVNNRYGLVLKGVRATIPFSGCNFFSGQSPNFVNPHLNLLPPYSGKMGMGAISVTDVDRFSVPYPHNAPPCTFAQMSYGIYTTGTSLYSKDNTFTNINDYENQGFGYGQKIDINGAVAEQPQGYAIYSKGKGKWQSTIYGDYCTVESNHFTSSDYGVGIFDFSSSAVTGSDFNDMKIGIDCHGAYSHHIEYDIHYFADNTMNDMETGISVVNSFGVQSLIANNLINTKPVYASMPANNVFGGHLALGQVVLPSRIGISIQEKKGVENYHNVIGNSLSNALLGIDYQSSGSGLIDGNIINQAYNTDFISTSYGIRANLSENLTISNNQIAGQANPHQSYIPTFNEGLDPKTPDWFRQVGIDVTRSNDYIINCNIPYHIGYGLQMHGENPSDIHSIAGNRFPNSAAGIVLKNYASVNPSLLDPTGKFSQIGDQNFDNNNQWDPNAGTNGFVDQNISWIVSLAATPTFVFQPNVLNVDEITMLNGVNVSGTTPRLRNGQLNSGNDMATNCNMVNVFDWNNYFTNPNIGANPLDQMIARGNVALPLYPQMSQYILGRGLLARLERDSLLTATDTVLSAFYDSAIVSGLGITASYQTALSALTDSLHIGDTTYLLHHLIAADSINELLNAESEQILHNTYHADHLYLHYLRYGVDDSIRADSAWIATMCISCPLIAGDAVYTCRQLYREIDHQLYNYDDEDICEWQVVSNKRNIHPEPIRITKSKVILNKSASDGLYAIPNPAKEATTIYYDFLNGIAGTLEVSDALSHRIIQKVIYPDTHNISIDISTLAKGIYFLKVNGVDGSSKSIKLILE